MEKHKTKCIFEEDTHQYFLTDAKTGDIVKELISVTTLLKKHGLAPNYDGIPFSTLEAKAKYGKLVHAEIENYIKNGEIGFSGELGEFVEYCKSNKIKPKKSEFIVYNDIVAGTVDMLSSQFCGEEELDFLNDFKTTTVLHNESVSWQLSLYAYLYRSQFGKDIAGAKAFHFNGVLKVIDIPLKPIEEVEKLIEAERNGEIYQPKQLVFANDLLRQIEVAENKIKNFESLKKEVESQADNLRKQIIEIMKAQNIKSFENDSLKITYIEPTTRETIDSTRLKKELPEIAEQYKKLSNVKASVRILLKGVAL